MRGNNWDGGASVTSNCRWDDGRTTGQSLLKGNNVAMGHRYRPPTPATPAASGTLRSTMAVPLPL